MDAIVNHESNLSAERLRDALHYAPLTGVFTWRIRTSSRSNPGTVAGRLMPDRYRRICLDGGQYPVHRLVWLYLYGRWPVDQIDHINGVRDDNRADNLREATNAINGQNRRRAQRTNQSSGLLGVSWQAKRQKWMAQIQLNGKAIYLGRFKTPEAAHAAYIAAKRQHHPGCTL
jgi:hypothetical protein